MRKTRYAWLNNYPTFNPDTETDWSAKEIYSDTTSVYDYATDDDGGDDKDDDIDENSICNFFYAITPIEQDINLHKKTYLDFSGATVPSNCILNVIY